MEFSRQEFWSGLPFPSPRRERKSVEGGFRKKGREREQRQRKKGEPAHEKNCLYLIPRSTGGRAGRRGGDTGNRMEEWAGPRTVTPSCWGVDPKQVRFPGLQAISSRVKKCLLRAGAGGGGNAQPGKSSERKSRISTGSAEDQEPIHHKVPSMSVGYFIFII